MKRKDGREPFSMRKLNIKRHYIKNAEGSCLISMGGTRVICTATVEESVPRFLRNSGKGWITAEYGMLPRSSSTRIPRESSRGKVGGRTHEIQRLIGRSLRSIVGLAAIGERTIWIDADVIEADGGTRTASITGAFIALIDALRKIKKDGKIGAIPVSDYVAAISVGIVDGVPMLDLAYEEDSRAEVDMNVVMTGAGKFIEIQGTAERAPFARKEMDELLKLAAKGIKNLIKAQRRILGDVF
ncbi:MAG: ribonuclease PH [Candidatus Omnitrophica bacterium CG1_02_49_10]|nr:MAG: ribonuclease PH [Candidatus Omnitrophica bacterium CG1_02_49_10]